MDKITPPPKLKNSPRISISPTVIVPGDEGSSEAVKVVSNSPKDSSGILGLFSNSVKPARKITAGPPAKRGISGSVPSKAVLGSVMVIFPPSILPFVSTFRETP